MSVNKYYRVPEKFQLQARLRRLRQQVRDGWIETFTEYRDAVERARADYQQRNALPDFIQAGFADLLEEEK